MAHVGGPLPFQDTICRTLPAPGVVVTGAISQQALRISVPAPCKRSLVRHEPGISDARLGGGTELYTWDSETSEYIHQGTRKTSKKCSVLVGIPTMCTTMDVPISTPVLIDID